MAGWRFQKFCFRGVECGKVNIYQKLIHNFVRANFRIRKTQKGPRKEWGVTLTATVEAVKSLKRKKILKY